jgi:hypothetical protein
MPASPHALRLSGLPDIAAALERGEAYGNLVGISASTKLNFLGDWVPLPDWLPFARPMSVGDVVVMIGLVWLLVRGMRTHRRGA